MKKCFSLLISIFLTLVVSAQTPALQWARSMGANLDDFGTASTIDAFGNVYITGSYQGTFDFDSDSSTLYLNSLDTLAKNLFISKIDKHGHLIWAKGIIGAKCEIFGVSIAVDRMGNVFTAGDWTGMVDFDPGSGTNNLSSKGNYSDGFVLKMDSLGNFVWVKAISGGKEDHATYVKIDNMGNAYIAGNFQFTIDFDSGPGVSELTASNSNDLFLLKLDGAGNFQWVKQIKSLSCSIALSESGSIYISSSFYLNTDVDPGPETYNIAAPGSGIFILKLDPSGNFKWALKIETQFFKEIALNSLGEIYLTGQFMGTVDFDPGPSVYNLKAKSIKGFDVYISKFDSSGNFLWAKSISSTNGMIAQSLTTDVTIGNIYLSGFFLGTGDFNPDNGIDSLKSKNSNDLFVLKLDSSGSYRWVAHFPLAKKILFNIDAFGSVITDAEGFIYLLGGYSGRVDFNPAAGADTLRSNGRQDIFFIKMGECFAPSVATTKNGNTITAKQDGASYKWFYCKNSQTDYMAIPGAINQSYTASKSGSYAVVVTLNGCSDTSTCVQLNYIWINELNNRKPVSIYPNPTDGILNIDIDVISEDSRIEVYNSYGQMILIQELKNKNSRFNTIPFLRGLYFLKVISNNKIIAIQKIEFIPNNYL